MYRVIFPSLKHVTSDYPVFEVLCMKNEWREENLNKERANVVDVLVYQVFFFINQFFSDLQVKQTIHYENFKVTSQFNVGLFDYLLVKGLQ